MDDDVVVVPAQAGEVVWVVAATVAAVFDVVDLEPVAGSASSNGTATVSPYHEAAHSRWDCFGVIRGDNGFAVL